MNAKPVECRIAQTAEERDMVYRLRYECYLRKGAIEPQEDARFSDRFDDLRSSFSILAEAGSKVLATVRINVVKRHLGWTESPATAVFGDEPAFQEVAGESYVEANRLCFGEQARRDSFVRLLGYMAALANVFDVEWLVACPRLEHVHVYESMFGFRKLAPPRRYFGVNFETQLLGIRRSELAAYVAKRQVIANAWQLAENRLLGIASTASS